MAGEYIRLICALYGARAPVAMKLLRFLSKVSPGDLCELKAMLQTRAVSFSPGVLNRR
jgi:hypothetical protein